MDSGWSVKHVVRTIVLSRTYRQASAVSPESLPGWPGPWSPLPGAVVGVPPPSPSEPLWPEVGGAVVSGVGGSGTVDGGVAPCCPSPWPSEFWCGCPANEIGNVDGEEIARCQKIVDGRKPDVVCIDVVGAFPAEYGNRTIGFTARVVRPCADDRVFAV